MSDLRTYLSSTAQRELDSLRAALDERLIALEKALAHPDQHESLEGLIIGLARAASEEAHSSAARKWLEAQLKLDERAAAAAGAGIQGALIEEAAALRREIETLQTSLNRERQRAENLRRDAEVAQSECQQERAASEQMDSELSALRRTNVDLAEAVETLRADLDGARTALAEAQRELGAARREADSALKAARAEKAAADEHAASIEQQLDALTSEFDAARRENAAALEAERERARTAETSFDTARARAEEADANWQKRLTAADDKIKELELQLFGRDRPVPGADADVDLAAMLEEAAQSGDKPIRRFSRYTFRGGIEVRLDDDLAQLVDLSVGGAQLLSDGSLDLNRDAAISLVSDEMTVSCRGRVVWTRADPHSKGRALRYRAGVQFTDADPAAVEAFIIRYSAT